MTREVLKFNAEEFNDWIIKNDIKNRTINDFWYYLENYKKDDPEDFYETFKGINVEAIKVHVSSISFALNYTFDEIVSYVGSFLMIEYNGDEIGEYEGIFTLDGEDYDDYLRIYKK